LSGRLSVAIATVCHGITDPVVPDARIKGADRERFLPLLRKAGFQLGFKFYHGGVHILLIGFRSVLITSNQ
jgi:hypothetical protein